MPRVKLHNMYNKKQQAMPACVQRSLNLHVDKTPLQVKQMKRKA